MPRSIAALLVLVPLAGCATSRERAAAARDAGIATLAAAPLTYRADLRGRGLQRLPASAFDAAARASDRTVEIECSVLAIDERALAELLGRATSIPSAWTSVRAEVEPAIAALRDAERCESITAPRLVVFDGAPAEIAMADQTAYVADFEVELVDGALVADPVVETLLLGLALRVRPALAADGRTALALALTCCDLERPIPEVRARLPLATTPVTVQTPLVRRQELATDVTLGADDCALIVAPDGDGYRLVLVSARAST